MTRQEYVHIVVPERDAHLYPGGPEGRVLQITNGVRTVAIPFLVQR